MFTPYQRFYKTENIKMKNIEIGKNYILKRPSFLLKGVIVQQNSTVEVKRSDDDHTYTVIYIDKEGFSHEILNIKPEELEEI